MDKKQHHILPIGRWAGKVHNPREGEPAEIVQVINRADIEALALKLNALAANPDWPGILLDVDHQSEDTGKESKAAGWYRGPFTVRNDGLWAEVELTPEGERLISSKTYKRLSPTPALVKNETGEYHPVDIASVALTNRPRMRELTLVTNSEDARVLTIEEPQTQEVTAMNEEVLTELGLAPDATAADAVAKIKVLNQTIQDHITLQTEREADAFVAEHGDKFADPAKARALYVQNAEAAKAIVAELKPLQKTVAAPAPAPEPEPTKVLNRADTRTPGPVVTAEATSSDADEARAVRVRNRAEALVKTGLTYQTAWSRAEAEENSEK
jgi:phage I-like protein